MSNIPNITDICGTVTQALAETIRNREALIAQLREENARAQNLLRERCINNASLITENTDLRLEIEGWKVECETNALDEKELYRLRAEVQSLRNQLVVSQNSHLDCDKQCKTLLEERDEARRQYCELVAELDSEMKEDVARANAVAIKDLTERHAHMSNIALGARADVHQTRRDLDKANKERDVARRLYCDLAANGSPATPPAYIAFQWGWDCFPQDNDPTPFLFDQSDSDPRTGVQYGDLH
jgi:hypothetical protein